MVGLQRGQSLAKVWLAGRRQTALEFAALLLVGAAAAGSVTRNPWLVVTTVAPAATAYLALKRATQLAEQAGLLRQSEERLQQLVERLLVAQEEERRRVAYDLHDGLAQLAAAAHQHLEAFAAGYRRRSRSPRARQQLDRALELAEFTVTEARRVIAGLRPTALDDFGLAAALQMHVAALRDDGWEISCQELLGDERLPPPVEMVIFRVALEALTNVRKHANSNRVAVTIERRGNNLHLEVRDWGRGFRLATAHAGRGERVGLAGMHERIALINGRLTIRSRPGAGTRIQVQAPFREAPQGAPA
jgi:signal transduction histidine kinase